MNRENFIQNLAQDVKPVKVVSTVTHQLSLWILLGALSSIVVAYSMSFLFPSFGWASARYESSLFWAEQILLLVAAVSSAWTAILLSRPGRDQLFTKVMSVGTLLLWSILGVSFFDSFLVEKFSQMPVMAGYKCLLVSAVSAIPAGALMSYNLKKGHILNKPQAVFFAFMAVTSLGAFALQFFCPNVDGLIKLVWHILPIYALSSIFYFVTARKA